MKPDLSTPIIQLDRIGWVPHIIPDRALEWGNRFDAGIGYRVFLKYADSDDINAFPPLMMRHIAGKIKDLSGRNPQFKELAKEIIDACDVAEKMNKLWSELGAPDQPVDQIKESGHA